MDKSDTVLDRFEDVADILRQAKRVLFVTGAGMSADSGLPTYRGIGGLYNQGLCEEGIPIEEALSGDMLYRKPALAWKYIARIEKACRTARHNRGHQIIANLEKHVSHVCVLTQNIDGFHSLAGSTNVIDIHGDLRDVRCLMCDYTDRIPDYCVFTSLPPVCPTCDNILRPGVVLFGEALPEAQCDRIEEEWEEPFDLVVTIGTTSVFPYIAQPVKYAKYMGIPTVEINPGETEVSPIVDYRFRAGAAVTLDRLWQAAFK